MGENEKIDIVLEHIKRLNSTVAKIYDEIIDLSSVVEELRSGKE